MASENVPDPARSREDEALRKLALRHLERVRTFVEEVRNEGRDDPVLAVRAGPLGRHLLLVPASEVAFIVPRAARIWLRSPVTLCD